MKKTNIWLYTTIEVLIVVVALLYWERSTLREASSLMPVSILNTARPSGSEGGEFQAFELNYPSQDSNDKPGAIGLKCVKIDMALCKTGNKLTIEDAVNKVEEYRAFVKKVIEELNNYCKSERCSRLQIVVSVGSKEKVEDFLQLQIMAGEIAAGLRDKAPSLAPEVVVPYLPKH